MAFPGARLAAWGRRHQGQAVAGLLLLAAALGWAGHLGYGSWTARSHLREAQQALDRRAWAEARGRLDQCLRLWPDSAEAHRLAARAARRLDILKEAERHLDTSERLLGGQTQATQVERALLRVHQGDLAGVEGFLRTCVAQDDPDAEEILDVLSAALISDYRIPEAHQCLDDLLRRRPDDFDILVRRAWTAQRQAWLSVAVESRLQALQLRPEADSVRLALAENLLTLGRFPEAREQLAILREAAPNHPGVLLVLARCLAEQGDRNRAVELFEPLLAREPNNPSVLGEWGRLCLERDRPEEAVDYLRRALALAPSDQVLLIRLSDCLRLLGKPEEARPYREKAERLQADRLRALQLTRRYREQGHKDADLCHELGVIHLRLDEPDDALRFFQKALKINPGHRPAQQSLAELRARTGAHGRADPHRVLLGQIPWEE